MADLDNEKEMTLEEFEMIRDFIHEKCGIFFAENKMHLVKNRLAKRMAELNIKTVRDYFYHVKYDISLKEFNHLMDLVTTNETSFFRNEPQLLSFSDEVLPLIIEQKLKTGDNNQIKIWSAGCSTGEEPYTLAIILLEKLMAYPGLSAEILAADISEEALQKARRGEYSGATLRNVKPEILDRYYTKTGELFRVKPEVKALVKFSHMNLNDPRKTTMVSDRDIIFCRNVMIYFSEEIKKQLVRNFYNALLPGGYLYIGHSETMHGISKAFKLVYFKNALVYQKEAVESLKSASGIQLTVADATESKAKQAVGATEGTQKALDLLSKIMPMTTKK